MTIVEPAGRPPPRVIVFDVNETLSDLSPIRERFEDLGAPAHLAAPWFAGLLRDGFVLTITGDNPAFADLAAASLSNGSAAVAEGLLERNGIRDVFEHVLSVEVGPA